MLVDAPSLWSMDELVLEVGDGIAASDAVARLHASGLVHRLEDFVFATRPAHRGYQLRR